MDNQLYSIGNSAQHYVAAWMGGEFGIEWIHAYEWLSPVAVCPFENITTLLIGYTPIQNKRFKKIKNALPKPFQGAWGFLGHEPPISLLAQQ